MNDDQLEEAKNRAARETARFIDTFDVPDVVSAAGRLFEAARDYGEALGAAGFEANDATRAAVGVVLKAMLP